MVKLKPPAGIALLSAVCVQSAAVTNRTLSQVQLWVQIYQALMMSKRMLTPLHDQHGSGPDIQKAR